MKKRYYLNNAIALLLAIINPLMQYLPDALDWDWVNDTVILWTRGVASFAGAIYAICIIGYYRKQLKKNPCGSLSDYLYVFTAAVCFCNLIYFLYPALRVIWFLIYLILDPQAISGA